MQEFKPTRELFGDRYNSVTTKMRKIRLLIVVAIILAMMMCFLMFFTLAYRVDKMNVGGSRFYSESQILDAAGLSQKSDMITFNAEKAESAIREACPYLHDVSVECDYPNTVKITVADEAHLFYASTAQGYVVLSDELRVLEISDSKEAFLENGYMSITVPVIANAEVGKVIKAADGRDLSYATSFLSSVLDSRFGTEITSVDVSEKFNLSVQCGAHLLYFGSSSNMETKLSVAYQMVDEGVFSRYGSALCNVSDPSGATVRENVTVAPVQPAAQQPETTRSTSSNGAVG
ncbi:MAG: FtsQ-type POTRA domain-containing protein [Clostridia bacterium]|nr:FtsQ-type POTRA domain-containing protein [Clostridia bacterium]